MDQRMVEFIRALRAAGVRISLAESQDAMYGIDLVGASDRDNFRAALKATLVKENRDHQTFEYFFPLFFSAGQPPLHNIEQELTPEQQQMLRDALQSLAGSMQSLRQLMQQMLQGKPFDQDQLDQMGQQAGLNDANEMYQRPWYERRMQRQSGLQQMQEMIDQLIEQLEQMGMDQQSLDQLRQMMQENAEGLSDQLSQYVGQSLAENMAEREPEQRQDLLDVPFNRLSQDDVEHMRDEIRRLAARLRSRASLRQRRAKLGKPDPRRTMRHNMKYGGVPLELQYNTHHVKPALVLICDISTSMRYCAEFLLTLIYELADQVARTNSYVFIGDLTDISMDFKEHEPRAAVEKVLGENRPGYYNTDLGNSLETFRKDHMGTITSRTTVIILGDGRNNYNNPRLEIARDMQRKARRLIWFNPEPPSQWGTGDSDMHEYAPLSDGVYKVSNLRELANAVDQILADG